MITFIFAMTKPSWQFVVSRHIKFLLRLLASRLPSHIKLIPSSLQILKLPVQRQQLFLRRSASSFTPPEVAVLRNSPVALSLDPPLPAADQVDRTPGAEAFREAV